MKNILKIEFTKVQVICFRLQIGTFKQFVEAEIHHGLAVVSNANHEIDDRFSPSTCFIVQASSGQRIIACTNEYTARQATAFLLTTCLDWAELSRESIIFDYVLRAFNDRITPYFQRHGWYQGIINELS